jgi:hypothetical protein
MAPGRVCQGEPYLNTRCFGARPGSAVSAQFARLYAGGPLRRKRGVSFEYRALGKKRETRVGFIYPFPQAPAITSVKIEKAFGSADGLYLFSSESGFWPQWNCFWKRVSWNKEHALQRLLRSIVWLFRQIFEFAFVQVDVTRSDWRMAKDIRWGVRRRTASERHSTASSQLKR